MKLRQYLACVGSIVLLAACDNTPKPRQAAGADCNAGAQAEACVAGHYCARAETDRGEHERHSNGGLFGP